MAIIPFSDVLDYTRLPVDSQDVVTKARIVVAGRPTGDVFLRGGPSKYYPVPVAQAYTAPEHATYHAERSFALPAGVDPFHPPTSGQVGNPTVVTGFTASGVSPHPVRDGDWETEITKNAAAANITYTVGAKHIVGFQLVYRASLDPDTPAGQAGRALVVRVPVGSFPFGGMTFPLYVDMSIPPADATREVFGVVPRMAGVGPPTSDMALMLIATANVATLAVAEFYPLIPDVPLLTDIAKAQIRLPASNPRRVTVRGVLPPGDLTHTIVGWPGGDYTGVVARQTYRAGETVVDFEQAGAPLGVPHEALEAERVRMNRTREAIQSATYATLVGSRRAR